MPSTSGAAADRDEHQVALDRLAVAEVHRERVALLLDLVHCLPSCSVMPRFAELLRELLRRVRVLLRDQRVEHLDDRHLGAEAVEDRRELGSR